MPIQRRADPARRGDPRDRRPMIPRTEPRNGVPTLRVPYTYRGTGRDYLTWWMGRPGGDLPVASMAELTPAQRLDVYEAIDGPGYFDRREYLEESA